jgi:hypothetical protein
VAKLTRLTVLARVVVKRLPNLWTTATNISPPFATNKSMASKCYGNRNFYQIPDTISSSECVEDVSNGKGPKKYRSKNALFRGSTRALVEMVDMNIIGRETVFQGPFGPRRSKFIYLYLFFISVYNKYLNPEQAMLSNSAQIFSSYVS